MSPKVLEEGGLIFWFHSCDALHETRASPEERAKFEINPSRTMILWDPAKCAINDEVRIADYLGPGKSSE